MVAPNPFADVLAAKLASRAEIPPRPLHHSVRTRPFVPRADQCIFRAPPPHTVWTPQPIGGDAAPKPPPRVLTDAERAALVALRELGAVVDETCDAAQLKRAFRQLALKLHPDRHPDADPVRHRQLAASFAEACAAYRALRHAGGAPKA